MARALAAGAALLWLLTGAVQAAEPTPQADSSGVAFPNQLDGLPLLAGAELKDPFNSERGYGTQGETVSLYVFRAASPNAALWFERADAIINMAWKSRGLGAAGPVTSFTLGGGTAPNGQRRTYTMSGRTKSTALAVAQVGHWLVKIRSSSDTLDPAGQEQRLDRIIAELRAPAENAPRPLLLPEICSGRPDATLTELITSEAIAKPAMETVMLAGVMVAAAADTTGAGKDSLADAPQLWCREALSEAGPVLTLYRPRDPAQANWIALFADSGTSFAGVPLPVLDEKAEKARGMLVTTTWERTDVILIAKGVPSPAAAMPVAAQHIMRGGPAYASVPYGTQNVNLSLPQK